MKQRAGQNAHKQGGIDFLGQQLLALLFQRNIQTSCDLLLYLDRQIAVDLLCLLQDGHHFALDAVVLRDDLKQLGFLLGSTAEIDRGQLLLHNF